MPALHVIHTVGPIYRAKPEDAVLLSQCYRNSLQLAVKNGISSLAFPAISCGAYGYPVDAAAAIAVNAVADFLVADATLQQVHLACFSKDIYDAYRKAFRARMSE